MDALARLLRGLDLEETGRDTFRARTGRGEERLFGGLLLAQTVIAAGRTITDRRLHSLHAYFVRAGRSRVPIEHTVERIRDGGSFSARRIVGRQEGEATIVAVASFVRREEGIAHQDPMPEAPGPEGLPDWEDLRAKALGDPSKRRQDVALELRVCDPDDTPTSQPKTPRRRVWMRPKGDLPDDPLLHAAVIVFSTDRTLLRVAARPHAPAWSVRQAASLDHAVWLHVPARFDDWLLYVCESPAAAEGRALALGAIYSRDGRRIVSVAQEGILRF